MATQNALYRLRALLELNKEAQSQAQALASLFSAVIEQVNIVKNSLDIDWPPEGEEEVLAEETTGAETEFQLAHPPVKLGSLQIYVDGNPAVIEADINYDTGVIVPTQPVPAGKRITASYTQLGLKSEVTEILEAIPSVSLADITGWIAKYQTAVTWLNENFS